MAIGEVVLALLGAGAGHGYDVKRGHDAWFPDVRPLAFGQVYATLARLERDGLVEVAGTQVEGGPERTVYALTDAGRQHLEQWLAEPAPVASASADEIVRKTVAALQVDADPARFLAAQRAAHLRRIRELQTSSEGGLPARLARDHLVAHLDADLRWLELAADRVQAARPSPAPSGRPEEALS